MKTLKGDVVVMAAGTAGLAAAVTAPESGGSVIAFEKLPEPAFWGGRHVCGRKLR